jgi:hypothetical protein
MDHLQGLGGLIGQRGRHAGGRGRLLAELPLSLPEPPGAIQIIVSAGGGLVGHREESCREGRRSHPSGSPRPAAALQDADHAPPFAIFPRGLLFLVLGLILVVYGFAADPIIYTQHSLGQNMNLFWGVVFAAFGAVMLLLSRRKAG